MVPAAKKKYWYQRAQQNLIEAAHLQAYLDWNKSQTLVVSPDLGKLMTDLGKSLHNFVALRESDEDYARKVAGDKLQQAQTDKALRILSGEHSATKSTRTVENEENKEAETP